MKNKSNRIWFLSLLLAFVLLVPKVRGAEAVPPILPIAQDSSSATSEPQDQSTAKKAITVATVNIYNSKLVSQDNNQLKLSFDLSNREGAQPEIKYAVQLIGNSDSGQFVADEKIYSETLSLGENEKITKEIDYVAPAYLSGTFKIMLISRNESSLLLALSSAGEVTLQGDNNFLEIVPTTCYLKVEGEAGDKKYTSKQGVDIKKEEKLVATCELINHFETDVSFSPSFKTYWRTTAGKLVSDIREPQENLFLNAGEQKSFSFILSKASIPQAYDAVLTLVNDQNQQISNQVAFHYVLRGLSATIQNLTLDKDYYQDGEIANAVLYWSGSADSFPGSRFGTDQQEDIFAEIEIKNETGSTCAKLSKEVLDKKNVVKAFDLPILVNCIDPTVGVIIEDAKGNILDKEQYQIKSPETIRQAMGENKQKTEQKTANLLVYGVVFATLLTILALGIIFFKKKSLMIFVVIFLGGCIFASGAKADTFSDGEISFTVNLDDDTYAPGGEITATGSAEYAGCSNAGMSAGLDVLIDGIRYEMFYGNNIIGSGIVASGSAVGYAPASIGDYPASFTGYNNTHGGKVMYDIWYKVFAPPPTCIPDCSLAPNVCTGIAFSNGCKGICWGTKPCPPPTCVAGFNPLAITAPGSALISWNSSPSTTRLWSSCTGPIISAGWNSLKLFNYPINFGATQTGKEKCIFTPYRGTVPGIPCVAPVTVNPPACIPNCSTTGTGPGCQASPPDHASSASGGCCGATACYQCDTNYTWNSATNACECTYDGKPLNCVYDNGFCDDLANCGKTKPLTCFNNCGPVSCGGSCGEEKCAPCDSNWKEVAP